MASQRLPELANNTTVEASIVNINDSLKSGNAKTKVLLNLHFNA
jgi:hypothetical protein